MMLGNGVKAEDLNDDCLGSTLDRLHDHDGKRICAGLAQRIDASEGLFHKGMRMKQCAAFWGTSWHAMVTSKQARFQQHIIKRLVWIEITSPASRRKGSGR